MMTRNEYSNTNASLFFALLIYFFIRIHSFAKLRVVYKLANFKIYRTNYIVGGILYAPVFTVSGRVWNPSLRIYSINWGTPEKFRFPKSVQR